MNKIAEWQANPAVIETQKKTLELRKYAAQLGIGHATLATMKLDMREDFVSQELIYRLELDVLADKIADDKYKAQYAYEVYRSPWQHFKDLYMPQWFKNRYPVQKNNIKDHVVVRFRRYAKYPKANIALQKDRRAFELLLGGFETIEDQVTQEK